MNSAGGMRKLELKKMGEGKSRFALQASDFVRATTDMTRHGLG